MNPAVARGLGREAGRLQNPANFVSIRVGKVVRIVEKPQRPQHAEVGGRRCTRLSFLHIGDRETGGAQAIRDVLDAESSAQPGGTEVCSQAPKDLFDGFRRTSRYGSASWHAKSPRSIRGSGHSVETNHEHRDPRFVPSQHPCWAGAGTCIAVRLQCSPGSVLFEENDHLCEDVLRAPTSHEPEENSRKHGLRLTSLSLAQHSQRLSGDSSLRESPPKP